MTQNSHRLYAGRVVSVLPTTSRITIFMGVDCPASCYVTCAITVDTFYRHTLFDHGRYTNTSV